MACKNTKKQDAPKQIEKETILFYTYGELPTAGYVYYDTIFYLPQYTLKIKNMGGCEPDGVDYQELGQHNQKMAGYMQQRFGKHWLNDFETKTKLSVIIP